MTSQQANKIVSVLDKATGRHSRFDVFDDWLEIVSATLEALPNHTRSVAQFGRMADDSPEAAALFEKVKEKYTPYEYERLSEAFALLLDSVDGGYYDTVGDVYMEFRISNNRTGQFFTPFPIAKMTASLICAGMEAEVHARIKTALSDAGPMGMAVTLPSLLISDPDEAYKWMFERVLPVAMPYYKPVTVNDPACGSGVMFLAAASCIPQWMTQLGLVQFYGMDIDQTCVAMARVNSMLYGLNGFGAKCVLSMTETELQTVPEPWQAAYREVVADPAKAEAVAADVRSWNQPALI